MTRTSRFIVAFAAILTIAPLPPLATTGPRADLVAAESPRDLGTASPESVGVSPERLRRLDAGLKRFVDDGRLAGVTALLSRRGKIVHAGSFGKRDSRTGDALQRDAIFQIASMTKPVTGVALMMLYEEGKWRLDDPVSRYIPEFSKLNVFTGENADGSMKLEPARRPMTMRELMTHSAGLGYVLNQNNPVDRLIIQKQVLNPGASLQDMVEKLATVPLMAQPGTRWYYSIAVDVQGYLVETTLRPAVRRVPEDPRPNR